MIVFENHAHGTQTFRFIEIGDTLEVGQTQVLRLELCGMIGCSCGGIIEPNQNNFEAIVLADGRLFIGGLGASAFLKRAA